MRDYTTNNYCDFLWINDLLRLQKSASNVFTKILRTNYKTTKISIINVIIFGTIVEVKQIGCKSFLYQIDDGTGVIACRHSEEQFEEFIKIIESEQNNSLGETQDCQQSFAESVLTNVSADDSVFNDRSIQIDEINIHKKGILKGLQSIWNDIYATFNSLIIQYNIGDSVLVQGKLYNYFNVNQIYINNIKTLDTKEEIMQLKIKLEDSFDELADIKGSKVQLDFGKRFSGLVTFDNIQYLNPTFSVPERIETVGMNNDLINKVEILTPNLDTTITFDTFSSKI